MVRECRPPAREPVRSWLARRSTMATSTSPTPARPPTSALSDLLRRSPPHAWPAPLFFLAHHLLSTTPVGRHPSLLTTPEFFRTRTSACAGNIPNYGTWQPDKSRISPLAGKPPSKEMPVDCRLARYADFELSRASIFCSNAAPASPASEEEKSLPSSMVGKLAHAA